MTYPPIVHSLAEEPYWGSISVADTIRVMKEVGVPMQGTLSHEAESAVKRKLRELFATKAMLMLLKRPYPPDFALLLRDVFFEASTIMRIDGDRKPACLNRFALMSKVTYD